MSNFVTHTMLDTLITSKTRIRLLLKFFMNSNTRSYLRSLSEEFNESTNGIRVELNRLSEAGLLEVNTQGHTVMYQANSKHPLFPEISNMVKKYLGIDQIIDLILVNLGNLKLAFVIGDYAEGKDTGTINLVLVGEINTIYLVSLVEKAEAIIKRRIKCRILSAEEYEKEFKDISLQKKVMIY